MIQLLFFGRLGELAKGVPTMVTAQTPAEIRRLLAVDFPMLGMALSEPQVLVSVNKMIVDWDEPLSEGNEVAFLPPVTGG
mgnify:CR=1 FL=1|jgi:molybdopterin synthase sulfur carrier subunit